MTKEIQLNDIKATLRKKMIKKYGSVVNFLRSEDGAKFGGLKIRPYLYSTGVTSFEPLKGLTEFFGMGTLTRKVVLEKTTTYYITK